MRNENLIFITGPVGCGKSEKAEIFRDYYGCVSVFEGEDSNKIQFALNSQPGPFLVLTAAPAAVLAELFPGSRVLHYTEACQQVGVSPFHMANGQINPAILAAVPERVREQAQGKTLYMYGVLQELAAERAHQLAKGFDSSGDDRYTGNELPQAAIAYALASLPAGKKEAVLYWPWAPTFWKPEGRRADLIKAAALLVAEIERMDREIAQSKHYVQHFDND